MLVGMWCNLLDINIINQDIGLEVVHMIDAICVGNTFTFTFTFKFSHLADAFVQSDIQGREQSS